MSTKGEWTVREIKEGEREHNFLRHTDKWQSIVYN